MYAESSSTPPLLPPDLPPDLVERFSPRRSERFSWEAFGDLNAFVKELAAFKGRLFCNEPMSRYTSIKIGGPADLLGFPKDIEDLECVLTRAHAAAIPVHIHGAGSNSLIKDGGIRGITLCLKDMAAELRVLEETSESMRIDVDAGYSLHALVRFIAKHGLQGMECLAGIPASVGGALAMNAGVPGGTVSDRLVALKIITAKEGIRFIPKEKLKLGYRRNELPSAAIVLAGQFLLEKGDASLIQKKVTQALQARKDKQPLELPNLGSVFMNPGGKKAGALIEDAGLKGVRVGGARISEKHANFIVNEGNASAKDVQILMRLIKDKVKDQTGIILKPEIKLIGQA